MRIREKKNKERKWGSNGLRCQIRAEADLGEQDRKTEDI